MLNSCHEPAHRDRSIHPGWRIVVFVSIVAMAIVGLTMGHSAATAVATASAAGMAGVEVARRLLPQ